jgi:hypothetical protein
MTAVTRREKEGRELCHYGCVRLGKWRAGGGGVLKNGLLYFVLWVFTDMK